MHSRRRALAAAEADATPQSGGAFRSLRHRNYRLMLAGQATTSAAQWMEQVARGWLIYEMTGSALLLGSVQAARAFPLLIFGVLGGVAADRFDRKKQLILVQLANMLLNLLLAWLILSGQVEPWHIIVTAALAGSVQAFQQPARQSMIPDVVPRQDIMNAIALNSGVLNINRTLGPTIAGILIGAVGVGYSYVFQAAIFLFATVWTIQLNVPSNRRKAEDGPQESMWASLMDGFAYVRKNRVVMMLLLLALVPIVLAQPYTALIPIFAKDVFELGPEGLGWLLSAPGAGAVAGAFLIARTSDFSRQGLLMVLGVIGFGAGLIAFAASPFFPLALLALFVVGVASTSYRAMNQTLLQTNTEDAYRGRVMSLYLLDRGLAPAGAVLAGGLATVLDARYAVGILGFLTVAIAIVAIWMMPQLRKLS